MLLSESQRIWCYAMNQAFSLQPFSQLPHDTEEAHTVCITQETSCLSPAISTASAWWRHHCASQQRVVSFPADRSWIAHCILHLVWPFAAFLQQSSRQLFCF